MNFRSIVGALLLGGAVAGLGMAVGCGDDDIFASGSDAGREAASPTDTGTGAPDTGVDAAGGCGVPASGPRRLLLSMNNASSSELVAMDLAAKRVDGRLTYPGFIGTTSAVADDPFLLQQATDVVARLDRNQPWTVVSSWNVRGSDRSDGGQASANPAAVAVRAGCNKAYVPRFNRNALAVLDLTAKLDAGAPERFIDLSAFAQAADSDGTLELTGAVYVPSKRRVYVLLGNVDLKKTDPQGFFILCTAAKPTVVAIDVDTDQVVSLGGTGPLGSIALEGYNPPLGGNPLAYDPAGERLLVLHAGCNETLGDGGVGAIVRRRVEEVSLASGQVKTLLSLDLQDFPSSFLYVDPTRAALAFFGRTFFWNPTETTLGPEIVGGPDLLAYDGNGNLVGPRATFVDGGKGVSIVSVSFTDAGSPTTVATDPFSDNTGFLSGAEIWPPVR